jgi:hypothetical protein
VLRLFKSILSADRERTAVFLADVKAKNGGWVQVRYDALDPEEIGVGRWVTTRTSWRTSSSRAGQAIS